jgi:peroxiredoxin
MKSKMTTGAAAFVMATMLISLSTAPAESQPELKIGQHAPNFTLKDQDGRSISLADYSGKIIVLEWTNPACPFVRRHYREHTMTALADQYKSRGVAWLAINSTEGDTQAVNKKFAGQNHIPYSVLDDSRGGVAAKYRAKSTPDMFIINKAGVLVYCGAIDNDINGHNAHRLNYVKKALDEVLAGKPVSIPQTKSYGCGVHYAE